jgi:hypothetical protein
MSDGETKRDSYGETKRDTWFGAQAGAGRCIVLVMSNGSRSAARPGNRRRADGPTAVRVAAQATVCKSGGCCDVGRGVARLILPRSSGRLPRGLGTGRRPVRARVTSFVLCGSAEPRWHGSRALRYRRMWRGVRVRHAARTGLRVSSLEDGCRAPEPHAPAPPHLVAPCGSRPPETSIDPTLWVTICGTTMAFGGWTIGKTTRRCAAVSDLTLRAAAEAVSSHEAVSPRKRGGVRKTRNAPRPGLRTPRRRFPRPYGGWSRRSTCPTRSGEGPSRGSRGARRAGASSGASHGPRRFCCWVILVLAIDHPMRRPDGPHLVSTRRNAQ